MIADNRSRVALLQNMLSPRSRSNRINNNQNQRHLRSIHSRGGTRWLFHQVPCLGEAFSSSEAHSMVFILCQSSRPNETTSRKRNFLVNWNPHVFTYGRRMTANGMFLASLNWQTTGWVYRGGLAERWQSHVAPDKRIQQTENRQNRPTESRAKIHPFEE